MSSSFSLNHTPVKAEASLTEKEPQVWYSSGTLPARAASRIAAYFRKRRLARMPTARR